MPITSVSLSTPSVPGPSNPIALNHRVGRPTTFQVTASSSLALGDFTVQLSLSDISNPNLITNSSIYPPVGSTGLLASSVAVWSALSSTPYTTIPATGSVGLHFNSSLIFPDGLNFSLKSPIAAIRLFSTAMSSHSLVLTACFSDGG